MARASLTEKMIRQYKRDLYQQKSPKTISELAEEAFPTWRSDDRYTSMSDDDLKALIRETIYRRSLACLAAKSDIEGKTFNKPNDEIWNKYSAEEILEMYYEGIANVPQEFVAWALSEVSEDSAFYELDGAPVLSENELSELDNVGKSAYDQRKMLQKYSVKTDAQEELLENKSSELNKVNSQIKTEHENLIKKQNDTREKIKNYENEFKKLEEKISRGEQLSDNELNRYEQMNNFLTRESKNLASEMKYFEADVEDLFESVKSTEELAKTTQQMEESLSFLSRSYGPNEVGIQLKYRNGDNVAFGKLYEEMVAALSQSIAQNTITKSHSLQRDVDILEMNEQIKEQLKTETAKVTYDIDTNNFINKQNTLDENNENSDEATQEQFVPNTDISENNLEETIIVSENNENENIEESENMETVNFENQLTENSIGFENTNRSVVQANVTPEEQSMEDEQIVFEENSNKDEEKIQNLDKQVFVQQDNAQNTDKKIVQNLSVKQEIQSKVNELKITNEKQQARNNELTRLAEEKTNDKNNEIINPENPYVAEENNSEDLSILYNKAYNVSVDNTEFAGNVATESENYVSEIENTNFEENTLPPSNIEQGLETQYGAEELISSSENLMSEISNVQNAEVFPPINITFEERTPLQTAEIPEDEQEISGFEDKNTGAKFKDNRNQTISLNETDLKNQEKTTINTPENGQTITKETNKNLRDTEKDDEQQAIENKENKDKIQKNEAETVSQNKDTETKSNQQSNLNDEAEKLQHELQSIQKLAEERNNIPEEIPILEDSQKASEIEAEIKEPNAVQELIDSDSNSVIIPVTVEKRVVNSGNDSATETAEKPSPAREEMPENLQIRANEITSRLRSIQNESYTSNSKIKINSSDIQDTGMKNRPVQDVLQEKTKDKPDNTARETFEKTINEENSNEILTEKSIQIASNIAIQTSTTEAGKYGLMNYAEKQEKKDDEDDTNRKIFVRFERSKQNKMKNKVQKVNGVARLKG